MYFFLFLLRIIAKFESLTSEKVASNDILISLYLAFFGLFNNLWYVLLKFHLLLPDIYSLLLPSNYTNGPNFCSTLINFMRILVPSRLKRKLYLYGKKPKLLQLFRHLFSFLQAFLWIIQIYCEKYIVMKYRKWHQMKIKVVECTIYI